MIRNLLYNLATDKYRGFFAGIAKVVLALLALIYRLIVQMMILASRKKSVQLGCKVISVGNITLGGTGKTALVEQIAKTLKEQGVKIAILSRGYRRQDAQGVKSSATYETMGDEPFMLMQKIGDVPVIVDADRVRGAAEAIKKYSVDGVILDDGFQQWKIRKDLEIVTIDAGNPFGNRYMIPRGILREPLSSLTRADIFVITKTNIHPDISKTVKFLREVNPRALIFESLHRPTGFYPLDNPKNIRELQSFHGKNAVIFCGIGDPDSFEDLIRALGIKVGAHMKFSDHYHYTRRDFEKIFQAARAKGIDTIITTEKDAARISASQMKSELAGLGQANNLQVLVLRIEMQIHQNEEFYRRLLGVFRA